MEDAESAIVTIHMELEGLAWQYLPRPLKELQLNEGENLSLESSSQIKLTSFGLFSLKAVDPHFHWA